MGRTKRPYTPKKRGCYECSQRRINCDRTEPSCEKCIAKGIECSGMGGKRDRFRNAFCPDLARRKKSSSPESTGSTCSSSASPPFSLPDDPAAAIPSVVSQADVPSHCDGEQAYSAEEQLWALVPQDVLDCSEPLSPAGFSLVRSAAMTRPVGDHIAPWQRFLLNHFSDAVAPAMEVMDDHRNGWRRVLLPLACADEMVLSSVLAVSAFHLSINAPQAPRQTGADPMVLYSRAVSELRRRSDLHSCDPDTVRRILVTIVVLLCATMVSGIPDFPIIFRMLRAALETGSRDQVLATRDPVVEFVSTQINRMRVYGSPFISRDVGVDAVADQTMQGGWAGYDQYLSAYPDQSDTLSTIAALRELAFRIYLYRASSAGPVAEMPQSDLVRRFRVMLASLPEAAPGQHVLVWPVFIAAVASCSPEERSFFGQFLERQFRRNGFGNIPRALEYLGRISVRSGEEDWTSLLQGQDVFIM
ncbi:hypothetical protein VTK73DRAFT_184 [Phialemonium thermophilum]|uniref:Zn(2)-C6 fungal-type domain-containing protein n=1 Tax=Phialemonium thermophilum TaxID=223376 RepID=A0ABR3XFN8_9PEZI